MQKQKSFFMSFNFFRSLNNSRILERFSRESHFGAADKRPTIELWKKERKKKCINRNALPLLFPARLRLFLFLFSFRFFSPSRSLSKRKFRSFTFCKHIEFAPNPIRIRIQARVSLLHTFARFPYCFRFALHEWARIWETVKWKNGKRPCSGERTTINNGKTERK